MKRSERHRLKENEVALSVARAREQFDEHKRAITALVAIVALVVIVGGGYFWWRHHVETQSRALLMDALVVEQAQVVPPTPPAPPPGAPATAASTPPPPPPGSYPTEEAKLRAALTKYLAAAESYPGSSAGIAARYHAAACLTTLGRTKEAIDQYRQVVDRAGTSLYADMAKLGMAEAQVQTHQYDAAITEYRELSSKSSLPTDAVLMQMGRAYQAAGRKAEAQQTFKRIVDEYPQSQYAQNAKRELDAAKTAGA